MLTNELFIAGPQESPQNKSDDEHVVELARDRDEVGHKVKRKREIPSKRDQEGLLPPWDARVAKHATTEDHAVGNEPGERAGALAPAGDHQHHDE